MTGAAIALVVMSSHAVAQTKPVSVSTISIASQDLDDALRALARQTGAQIVFDPSAVRGRMAPAASGAMTSEQALARLLANTGLTYRSTGPQTFTILVQVSDASQPVPAAAEPAPLEAQEEIIVTAQRREERLRDVPMSLTVMTGQKLDSAPSQGLSEALNSIPAVATTGTYLGGGTNIAVRGVGASFPLFAGQSAVSYYLDSAPFGLVKSAIGPDANVYDLNRVEVLRGPQGTLYGASALNGVVRILTHDPDLNDVQFKAKASTSTTDRGGESFGIDATVNAPLVPGRFAVRATAGYHDNAGWIDQVNRRDANDSENQNYRVRVLGQFSDEFSVGVDTWVSRFDAGAPDQGVNWDRSQSAVDQPISSDYDVYALRLNYDGPGFAVSSVTSHLKYDNTGNLGLDVPFFNIPNSNYYSRTDSKVTSEEININSTGDGPWRWSVGGMYREGTEDLFQHFTPLLVPDIQYYNKSKSYAVYGQITHLLFDDRLELAAGLRYFDDNLSQRGRTAPNNPFRTASSDASATTPRVTATWHVDTDAILYASYSEGFRSGFPQTPVVLEALPTFPSAQPDRLKNYEVGARGDLLDGAVSYDIAAYHIAWKDIQLQLGLTINNLPYVGIVNGATAKGNGADVSLTFRPARGFSISPYLSVNDLHIDSNVFSGGQRLYADGDRPSNSPSTSAGVTAEYRFNAGALPITLSGSGSYLSSQSYRALSGPTLLIQEGDGIFTTRASVAVDLDDRWTATLFGSNLNNEHGATAIVFPGQVPNWTGRVRPLTVGLQLEYRMQ